MTHDENTQGNRYMTRNYHLTEMGNAQRMLDIFGEDIKYNASFGFLLWNGKQWVTQAETEIKKYAELAVLDIYDEESYMSKKASKSNLSKADRDAFSRRAGELNTWARRSETSKMLTAMCELIKHHCYIAPELFDTHAYYVNFVNGTLDLRTGTLLPHTREHFLTQCLPHAYNPLATCPTFEKFYCEIFLGNTELMHYFHKCLGYSMTSDVSEQCFFILLGTGGNGKSTLMETISHALGEYADTMNDKSIAMSSFTNDGSTASPDIARLKGKRLVIVSETEDGTRLRTQLIKRMTGGDSETARYLHKDPFTFHYSHKLFIYTNHELVIRETGYGMWRRVRKIPFDYTTSHMDILLPKKLQSEMEGILNWLVKGALLWVKEGLQPPETVVNLTNSYREEQDILAQFIRDCCEIGEGYKEQAGKLHKAFNKWQEDEGMKLYSSQVFKRMMLDHGYRYARQHGGNRVYHGLNLATSKNLKTPTVVDATNGHKPQELNISADLSTDLAEIEGL